LWRLEGGKAHKDIRNMQLQNKTAVILGVADKSSIAWSIARRFLDHGAKVHIGYQQKFFSRVRLLMMENPQLDGARCDVLNPSELEGFFNRFRDNPIDILVHSIAFGPPDVFTAPPSKVRSDSFGQTLAISTHSLLATAGYAKEFLREWGSIMTLTYQASEQASPFYGLMGVAKSALESCVRYLAIEMGQKRVRVNAISPGPIETPAAVGEVLAFLREPSSINTPSGTLFKAAMAKLEGDPTFASGDELVKAKAVWNLVQRRITQECAMSELVTQDDVADCALFLASDLARKITGQVIHVDCGLSSSRLIPSPE
jgi:enoyl-[acyl-carrier protein] reductase I